MSLPEWMTPGPVPITVGYRLGDIVTTKSHGDLLVVGRYADTEMAAVRLPDGSVWACAGSTYIGERPVLDLRMN